MIQKGALKRKAFCFHLFFLYGSWWFEFKSKSSRQKGGWALQWGLEQQHSGKSVLKAKNLISWPSLTPVSGTHWEPNQPPAVALSLSISLLETWFSPQPHTGTEQQQKDELPSGTHTQANAVFPFFLLCELTSAGGSQCRVSVPADALGLGLQSWVLTVAWQHGRFLTSFETNIWLAVVPKLCGAAECFCSREAAVWQRQRSHIFSHRSPPPPPPLFFSKTVFFFYICATASCLLHGHPLGLQWFSAEYGTIPPPYTHTHILSHSLFVFAAEGLVQGWGSKCFPGWRKLSAWWWERYKANSWDIRLGDKRKETLTLIKPCGSNTFLCLFALFLALFNNRLSVYGCF